MLTPTVPRSRCRARSLIYASDTVGSRQLSATPSLGAALRDIGVYGRWRDFVAVSAFPLIVLLIDGATTDGPLLSSTALVSYPLAVALCAGGFAWLRRRYRSAGPTETIWPCLREFSWSRAWRGVLVYFGLTKPQAPRRRSRLEQAAVAAVNVIVGAYWLLTAAFGGGSIFRWLLGAAFLVLAAGNFWQVRGRQRS